MTNYEFNKQFLFVFIYVQSPIEYSRKFNKHVSCEIAVEELINYFWFIRYLLAAELHIKRENRLTIQNITNILNNELSRH